MRASDLRIEKMLKFDPEQGKIFLNGSRVLIFDATALGKLRKDLIDTLGMERAKGFLIRYGWSCGFQAAISLKEQFQWDDDLEWTYAGPIMHTLEGFVKAQPNVDDFDPQTGIWRRNAIWANSFEAEQHILHLGYHNEPVCWMLQGYASGYGSAYLGKRVIFKEIKCVGKGDEHCTNIGKTLEDWGEEIVPELAYYEVSKISEELEAANGRIIAQNSILERIVTIHERLTQCILKGKGLDDIAASLAEVMKCVVILEDRYLVPQNTCFPKQNHNNEVLMPYLSISTSPSFKNKSSFYIQQKRPFQITDQYSDSIVYRLVSPILVGSQLMGFVSLLRTELAFSELENIALEHAAGVFALEILRKKEIAEIENRLKGDFVEDLLSGRFSDPNAIINRARALQYDITIPHRVLVLDIHEFDQLVESFDHDEKKISRFKIKLANIVRACLERLGKGMIINKNENLILLHQLEKSDSPEKESRILAEAIIKEVSELFPKVIISIGIGSICTDLTGFHPSFQSANKALDLGKALKKWGQVISLEQFGTHALLFGALNPKDLFEFATSHIGALIAYDETYQTQLISTLQEFLTNRGSLLGTANAMHLSVSGLKYRLQRIEEITGQDTKDSQVCFNLQMALNILQLGDRTE